MKKSNIVCFVAGAMIFGTAGAFAGQYIATENPYPIQLNGEDITLQGYNINDNTYFKLRDISSVIGGFDVDFYNNTILLSKDGYVYDKSIESVEKIVVEKFKKQFNISDNDPNTKVVFQDMGDYYTISAKRYTCDPGFPYDEWGCVVDKNTLEFSKFAN